MQQQSSEAASAALAAAAKDLRSRGNQCFRSRDYDGALEFYTRSVEKCSQILPDGSYQLRFEELRSDFINALSNKAEVFLRIGSYTNALDEAAIALCFEPNHVKTLARRARALAARQVHQSAVECLEKATQISPENQDLRAELERSRRLLEQQQHGSHDVPEFVYGDEGNGPEPEYADYIGPVEIRMTPDGRGRGLFVTRDVQPGELLLVTNAVIYGVVDSSYDLLSRLKQLQLTAQDSFNILRRLSVMNDGTPEKQQVPVSIELFYPKEDPPVETTGMGSKYQVSLELLNKVYNANVNRVQKKTAGHCHFEGLWLLPSFINHSCCPNASQHMLGKVMFNFAAEFIPSGGEVVTCYVESLVPWNPARREQCLAIVEADCNCRRCLVEKRLERPLASLSKAYQVLRNADYKSCSSAERRRIRKGFANVVAELELHVSSLSDELEKQFVRAAYVEAYLHQVQNTVELGVLARAVRAACPVETRVLANIYKFSNGDPAIRKLLEGACIAIYDQCSTKRMDKLVEASLA